MPLILTFSDGEPISLPRDAWRSRIGAAMFCPLCGQIWMRVSGGDAESWYSIRAECLSHGGTLFPHFNWYGGEWGREDLLKNPSLLRREFEAQMAWAEEQARENPTNV